MKTKRKAAVETVAGAGSLAREDWDFEPCPAGRELDCWLYEYVRESPEIMGEYQECKEHPCAGYAVDTSFDENGNWSRTIDILDENGDLAEAQDDQHRPHPVLTAFAAHLQKHLLGPSQPGSVPAGHLVYEPPEGVIWS
jgi:hypothetical protein